jgi:hypothetical protein
MQQDMTFIYDRDLVCIFHPDIGLSLISLSPPLTMKKAGQLEQKAIQHSRICDPLNQSIDLMQNLAS